MLTAPWWRFSSYELRKTPRGKYIAPAAGARLRAFDFIELAAKQTERPYLQLKAALRELPEMIDGSYVDESRHSRQAEGAILNWCNQYGLLGVLLHRTLAVTLAPRWRRYDPDRRDVVPFTASFSRHDDLAWRTGSWPSEKGDMRRDRREGALVKAAECPPDLPTSGAVVKPLGASVDPFNPVPDKEPLALTWASFFPGVPARHAESHAYPEPESRRFWMAYAEPLQDFVGAGEMLAMGLEPARAEPNSAAYGKGMVDLVELASFGRHDVERAKDGTFQRRWVSRSLLSALAMLAIDDLTRRYLRYCHRDRCGAFFVSDAHQAAYCSPRCQNAAQVGRHRRRAAAARKAATRGPKRKSPSPSRAGRTR